MDDTFIITKNDIYIAQIAMYEYDEKTYLKYVPLDNNEEFRKVLFLKGHVIDFKTGEEIYSLKIEDDLIVGDIFENTMYCINLIKPNTPKISDRDLMYASKLYEEYLERQRLIKEGKIILFPKRNLTRIK